MKQVLIIEDNDGLCAMYETILEDALSFQFEIQKKPKAIRNALNRAWDLIVSDVDIEGLDVAEIKQSAKCKLVFLTGAPDSPAVAGFKAYSKEHLASRLQQIIEENLT